MSLIFVSITSICNEDIEYTLEDLCKKARFPETLHIVVNIADESEKLEYFKERFSNNPHITVITHDYDCDSHQYMSMVHENTQHINNEMYYLQIHPNQRFVMHWDVVAIHMLGQCFKSEYTNDKKALLTTVGSPVEIFQRDMEFIDSPVPHYLDFDYIEHDHLQLKQVPIDNYPVRRIPIRSYIASAKFIFTMTRWAKQVVYDESWNEADEDMIVSIESFLCGWEIFNSYELLSYQQHSDVDDSNETNVSQVVDEFMRNNELKVTREIKDYTFFSGYDCISNTFVEKNMDFVHDSSIWKNLYDSVQKESRFSVMRSGKNVVVVSVCAKTHARNNHFRFGKRHDYTVVKVDCEVTHDEIIAEYDNYDTIVIITEHAIFSKFTDGVRHYIHHLNLDLANKSYICSSKQLALYGKSRTNCVLKLDLCTPHDQHVFRTHRFMTAFDNEETIFQTFNSKMLFI